MTYPNIRNTSFVVSVGFHALLILLFFLIKFTIDYQPVEFVELGFGTIGGTPSGGLGTKIEKVQESTDKEKAKEAEKELKKVELPKSQNTSEENVITQTERSKEKTVTQPVPAKTKETEKPAQSSTEAIGSGGEGPAGFGYEIDFGGKGVRKIYSYILPSYPDGVSKEIDVKLRFTILPDGTVGTIFPIIKADPRLENAAIHSLRQWRFEPLPGGSKKQEQTAVIVFPYRLQ